MGRHRDRQRCGHPAPASPRGCSRGPDTDACSACVIAALALTNTLRSRPLSNALPYIRSALYTFPRDASLDRRRPAYRPRRPRVGAKVEVRLRHGDLHDQRSQESQRTLVHRDDSGGGRRAARVDCERASEIASCHSVRMPGRRFGPSTSRVRSAADSGAAKPDSLLSGTGGPASRRRLEREPADS